MLKLFDITAVILFLLASRHSVAGTVAALSNTVIYSGTGGE